MSYGIRLERSKDWPCPWFGQDQSASSEVQSWPLAEARKYVDDHRSEERLIAVYCVRGFYQKKIYPVGDGN